MKIATSIYTFASIILLGTISAWAQTTTPGSDRGEWKEKWKQMTPEQKETFLKNHPKIAQWMAEHQQQASSNTSGGTSAGSPSTTGATTISSTGATPPGSASTGAATTSTATAPATVGARAGKWAQMTPEQKETFLQNHPKMAQQFSQNHPEAAQRLATTKEAGAGIADPGHPRMNEVNGRETNQQNRIAQGASSGTLTPQQQAQLQRSGNCIQKQEGNDLAKNDGHLTVAEKARLNREENRRSRHISEDKHD